jgi:hypothetical protein
MPGPDIPTPAINAIDLVYRTLLLGSKTPSHLLSTTEVEGSIMVRFKVHIRTTPTGLVHSCRNYVPLPEMGCETLPEAHAIRSSHLAIRAR